MVLLSNGTFEHVLVPNTAQEICTTWKHEDYFPEGVFFHSIMHLTPNTIQQLFAKNNSQPNFDIYKTIVSVSLLQDMRNRYGHKLMPNYHELPSQLASKLIFGHALIVFTIDGCNVMNSNQNIFKHLLNFEAVNIMSSPSTPLMSRSGKKKEHIGFGEGHFTFGPRDDTDDDGRCKPMDCSDDFIDLIDWVSPIKQKKKTKGKKLLPTVRVLF